ncbi:MAG: rRNA adenine N-6-methyltransferase family protein [Eggerthellaceae bacterium]|nr:rRNA adenine N-6-methyltransferase family protein [Eggerthellaceae bacterium]
MRQYEHLRNISDSFTCALWNKTNNFETSWFAEKKGRVVAFLVEFIKHPRTIGAVAPSGKSLSLKMMEPIDFSSARVIVEYGPGPGSFTRELVARRQEGTTLILIDQNKHFCKQLEEKFGEEQDVHVIHGSAEDVNRYLNECGFDHADFIISGLPFTSLPKNVSNNILEATKHALGEMGQFSTFQYSLVKKAFFEEHFEITDILHEAKNLPPAYILVMRNKRN